MTSRLRLCLVKADRPLGPLTRAEKLARAKAWLQSRGRYILDRGTPKPAWGIAGEIPPEASAELARYETETDRNRRAR